MEYLSFFGSGNFLALGYHSFEL